MHLQKYQNHSLCQESSFKYDSYTKDTSITSSVELSTEKVNVLYQRELDQIAEQIERNQHNLGYHVGNLLRNNIDSMAASVKSFTQSISKSAHWYLYGNSELHFAILNNQNVLTTKLAGDKKLINAVNIYGETPLMLASKLNNLDIVRLLIENGANAEQIDVNGKNALLHAAEGSFVENAKFLIKHGSKASALDAKMNSGIHIAAKSGNLKMIQLFHKYKIPFDDFNSDQFTPLMIAAGNQKFEAVEYLLNLDADMAKRYTPESNNAFQNALIGEDDKVINLFIQKGVTDIVEFPAIESAPKNWATLFFEQCIRTILTNPKAVDIQYRWNDNGRWDKITITIEDRTYPLLDVFKAIQWEAIHFEEQEYELLKNSLSYGELEKMENLDSILKHADIQTDNFRYSFGADFKAKYKNLNEVDKFLIYSVTGMLSRKVNEVLGGLMPSNDVNLYEILPKMGFLVNALNKIPTEQLNYFTCRGQADFFKKQSNSPKFVSLSRIFKVCKLYATQGDNVKRFGKGHIVFFKNVKVYDISGLSSIPLAAEYITLPKIISYTNEYFNNSNTREILPFYFGHLNSNNENSDSNI